MPARPGIVTPPVCLFLRRELLNEPRLGSFDTTQGLAPGSIICDWVGEMAAHVK